MSIKKLKLLLLLIVVKNEHYCLSNKVKITVIITGTTIVICLIFKDKIFNSNRKDRNNINKETKKEKETWTVEDEKKIIPYRKELIKNLYDFFKKNDLLNSFKYNLDKTENLLDFQPNNLELESVIFILNRANTDASIILNKFIEIKNDIEKEHKHLVEGNHYLYKQINELISKWEEIKTKINEKEKNKQEEEINSKFNIDKMFFKSDIIKIKSQSSISLLASLPDTLKKPIYTYTFLLGDIVELIDKSLNLTELNNNPQSRTKIRELVENTDKISTLINDNKSNLDSLYTLKTFLLLVNNLSKNLSEILELKNPLKELSI